MDIMVLPVVSRWLHIGAAIVAVGGLFFLRLVLTPAAEKSLSDDVHAALRDKVMARWKTVVHASVALLLISGLYNYYRALSAHPGQTLYHGLAGVKILLALAVFVIATGLVGRSPAFAPLRQKRKTWLAVNLVLATLVVLLGGVLRHIPTVGGIEAP